MKKYALIALVFALPLAPAQAAYSVDTGTPTGSTLYSLHSSGVAGFQQLAGQVSFGATTTIGTIEGYIYAPGVTDVQIGLFANTITLGNMIMSQTFSATVGEGWQGISFLPFDLAAGTYWVTFVTFEATPVLGMRDGVPSPLANYAFINKSTSGKWINQALNFGVRIGDGAVRAVPEPASWALMIGGMALAGAALRRRTETRIRFA